MNKDLKVKCPHCDKTFPYYESAFRPFCSERCQKIDLGHWFKESYAVPTKEVVPSEEIESGEDNEENNSSEYEH